MKIPAFISKIVKKNEEDSFLSITNYFKKNINCLELKQKLTNNFENKIKYLELKQKLNSRFLFYVGDYFHNFGAGEDFKYKNPLIINSEDNQFIANTFLYIRSVSIDYRIPIEHIINSLLEESLFSENLKYEIKENFNKKSDLYVKAVCYQLIILRFRKIKVIIKGGFFNDKVESLEDFIKIPYGFTLSDYE